MIRAPDFHQEVPLQRFIPTLPRRDSAPAREGFCVESGASAHVIKRAARHASIETSLRYIEPDNSAAREVLYGMF